jgi:hypothetical protein
MDIATQIADQFRADRHRWEVRQRLYMALGGVGGGSLAYAFVQAVPTIRLFIGTPSACG